MDKNAINPWKKLSLKQIYDNPWITVEEYQVVNPRGGNGIYGKVRFKNKAIGIIPIDEGGNTWLVGQYRFTLDEYSWEIPMGGGPLDVPVLESARRELKEETGLTAEKWTKIMRIHTSNSVTDEEGFIFLAQSLTEGSPEFDETEDLKIIKLPFEEVYQMVMEGKITDSLSVAGILKAQVLLRS
ncbi:NUDIX hydrolase [Fulvivirgaceae bacterium BMA12]|uniref:GDP-mannose pyrophosphatase n=1 Tax=Agaribacillus aureus TaxID=3051825 RepID=A0ABT8LJY4_9BACT|nr:NUDIX hydrolase [Fulvivirgaceae bacterium BMA12]